MARTYVLDTNVLLHNPNAIFAFGEDDVVIPFAVIEEIDNQKKRQDELGKNARTVSQTLDKLRPTGRLSEGVPLDGGGSVRIELNHQEIIDFPKGLDPQKYDNRILAVACGLNRENPNGVVLVTKDLNLRLKADVLGIYADDLADDRADCSELYTGTGELQVSREDLDGFFRSGKLAAGDGLCALPHQFYILRNCASPSQSALSRYFRGRLWPLKHGNATCWGIKALNKEQKFAFELLLNDDIKVVTLAGRAGTGKTLLALAAGLEKVLEEKRYGRLLVTRPIIPVGNDLGYLPGDKEEKLRPWMQPLYDNLAFLFSGCSEPFDSIDHLMQRGALELEALTYIRGRSIPKQFIICDEAQNLTPHMLKTLITRVGEGAKIVFTGDPEQIDNPYLTASSSGLTCLVEKFKGEELAGHVTLFKGERSGVAELGAKLL